MAQAAWVGWISLSLSLSANLGGRGGGASVAQALTDQWGGPATATTQVLLITMAAVPEDTPILQREVYSILLPPYLKDPQHPNGQLVLHRLWAVNPKLVKEMLLEYYLHDREHLPRIHEICQELQVRPRGGAHLCTSPPAGGRRPGWHTHHQREAGSSGQQHGPGCSRRQRTGSQDAVSCVVALPLPPWRAPQVLPEVLADTPSCRFALHLAVYVAQVKQSVNLEQWASARLARDPLTLVHEVMLFLYAKVAVRAPALTCTHFRHHQWWLCSQTRAPGAQRCR